ncbi:hypothetical protein, partial [Caldisalinibacter kiritimatiensis]|uniref:hypothetical protein n=1 Tax=Caldisalinibacter kiritimatiensis TaxID=1304284 RepID=UPI000559747F
TKINQLLNELKKLRILKLQGIEKNFLGTGKGFKYKIFLHNHITKKNLIIVLSENRIIECSKGDYKILNSDSKYKTLLENIDNIYNSLHNEVNLQH